MKRFSGVIQLTILLIALGACRSNFIGEIKRGAHYEYKPGFPELRLEVSEHISDGDSTFLSITGHVVENSLVFKSAADSLRASLQITIDVINHDNGENHQTSFFKEITRSLHHQPVGEQIFGFTHRADVPPGNYEVIAVVTDLASNKTISRVAEAFLPDPEAEVSNITNISILTKNNEEDYIVETTYDISNQADSVKFTFQITNSKPESPITIQARLIKFNSDTSVASPMSFNNPSASSIRYKGIEYDDYEIIQSSLREFHQPGNVYIEYIFPSLEQGNYRFEVAENIDAKDGLYKGRDFGVKSPNYPAVVSAQELAKPLIYIIDDFEYEKLQELMDNDEELKQAIDRFWLSNIKNSRIAKSVISLYYQRVEEANKMFSGYKEGWKTDMGRVYILFGPPWYEYKRLVTVQWSYSHDRENPEFNFHFKLPKVMSYHYPFDNYILQRNKDYFNIEYQQINKWRTGQILD